MYNDNDDLRMVYKMTPESTVESMSPQASSLSQKAHEGQTRIGGVPYYEHTLHVARIAHASFEKSFSEVDMQTLLSAAFLHDSIEDQPERMRELLDGSDKPQIPLRELFDASYGHEVVDVVYGVTNDASVDASRNYDEKILHYTKGLSEKLLYGPYNPLVFAVKFSDYVSNAGSLKQENVNLRRKYLAANPILIAACKSYSAEFNPEDYKYVTEVLNNILLQLQAGKQRF